MKGFESRCVGENVAHCPEKVTTTKIETWLAHLRELLRASMLL
ncbi:hypothetical protein RRSWK_06720 [Rhodopirellula sp. SWK7]|nr:hypothetical protein RRSWK_06720 [Rhodopirellula sp. SWK7]